MKSLDPGIFWPQDIVQLRRTLDPVLLRVLGLKQELCFSWVKEHLGFPKRIFDRQWNFD